MQLILFFLRFEKKMNKETCGILVATCATIYLLWKLRDSGTTSGPQGIVGPEKGRVGPPGVVGTQTDTIDARGNGSERGRIGPPGVVGTQTDIIDARGNGSEKGRVGPRGVVGTRREIICREGQIIGLEGKVIGSWQLISDKDS